MSGEATRFRAGQNAKKAGKAGGKASGQTRRTQATARLILRDLLARPLPATSETEEIRGKLGIPKTATAMTGVMAALINSAVRGDVKAINLVLGLLGESPEDRRHDDRMRLENERLDIERQRAEGGNEQTRLAEDWIRALMEVYDESGKEDC